MRVAVERGVARRDSDVRYQCDGLSVSLHRHPRVPELIYWGRVSTVFRVYFTFYSILFGSRDKKWITKIYNKLCKLHVRQTQAYSHVRTVFVSADMFKKTELKVMGS